MWQNLNIIMNFVCAIGMPWIGMLSSLGYYEWAKKPGEAWGFWGYFVAWLLILTCQCIGWRSSYLLWIDKRIAMRVIGCASALVSAVVLVMLIIPVLGHI